MTQRFPPLTADEIIMLSLFAQDKTETEVADGIGTTSPDLRNRIIRVLEKLDATSITHAIDIWRGKSYETAQAALLREKAKFEAANGGVTQ